MESLLTSRIAEAQQLPRQGWDNLTHCENEAFSRIVTVNARFSRRDLGYDEAW